MLKSVESRRLRSRRTFLDHHRPCSSITRRRRRRGGVGCRRRDAQWPCRPRLFEQYASTRRDDTDPDRASQSPFHPPVLVNFDRNPLLNPLCTWPWIRDYLLSSFVVSFSSQCTRSFCEDVSSFGIRRKTMWPTGRLVSSHKSRGDWEGKRGYIIIWSRKFEVIDEVNVVKLETGREKLEFSGRISSAGRSRPRECHVPKDPYWTLSIYPRETPVGLDHLSRAC